MVSALDSGSSGPGARFSKVPKRFRTRKLYQILNLMTTELLYSNILNMNRGSLHTRNIRLFKYRLTKMALRARKISGAFEKRAPGSSPSLRHGVVFLGKTLAVPFSTQVYKWVLAN